VEIAEAMQNFTDAADNPSNACFLGVDFPFQNVAEHIPLAIEHFNSGKILAVLLAARTGVAGMLVARVVKELGLVVRFPVRDLDRSDLSGDSGRIS